MAIRLFFFLLVFANLLLFAWTQGYFGTIDEDREPQRLTQQLHPEKLRIQREMPAPAPATKMEAVACRVVSNLAMADAETLKSALETLGGEASVSPQANPVLYFVVIAELANRIAVDKKTAELNRLGLEGHSAVALEGGRHEILLARFEAESAATEHLQTLARRGVKSARIEARQPPTPKAQVEARAAATMLLQQLPKLIAPYAEATLGDCPGQQ